MSTQVLVDREVGVESPEDECFRRWIDAALKVADHAVSDDAEVSLRINGIKEMSELNRRFRNKAGPTNVLSFPADLPEEIATGLLGDIVICAPVVASEAREQRKPATDHWTHLTVHGLLHLLGFDHVDDDDAAVMEALEISVLATLGCPNPYLPATEYP